MKKSHTIAFQLLEDKVYQFQNTTFRAGKQQQVSYSCSVKRTKRFFANYYTIKRSPTKVVPVVDSPYMEALHLTNMLWKELKLVIDYRGVIHDIINYKTIQQFWKEILHLQLSTLFTGIPIDQLNKGIGQLMEDKSHFQQRIKEDFFFLFWLKKSCGKYNWCDKRKKYFRTNTHGQLEINCEYEIETPPSQGLVISGKGTKLSQHLQQLKIKWGIAQEQDLSCSESMVYELNKQGELVYVLWEEEYQCAGDIFRMDTISLRVEN
ncbi:hypothetical protein [Myroides sp. DW712]|uniref:hypothetical protein n=1 Tax=Myroides sp. DW712 TaxID=3389800 RepID=UPI00397AF7E1